MNGPFPLAPILNRLRTVAALRFVGNAADLRTALDQQPAAVPAAFVVRQERARPAAGASGGVLVQQMDVDVIVVLYVRNSAGAASGEGAAGEMDATATAVRTALLNWRPSDGVEPLTMNASRDEGYRGNTLIAQELYRSRYRIEVR